MRRHLGFKSFPKFAKTNNRILLNFSLLRAKTLPNIKTDDMVSVMSYLITVI